MGELENKEELENGEVGESIGRSGERTPGTSVALKDVKDIAAGLAAGILFLVVFTVAGDLVPPLEGKTRPGADAPTIAVNRI